MKIRPSISSTSSIPTPNQYVSGLMGEYSRWAYDEGRAPSFKGKWREEIFSSNDLEKKIDLEIGTGNGTHFAHHAKKFPERGIVGLEMKYKPLYQAIRRAVKNESVNMRILRYNAFLLNNIFDVGELDNVYIHFPDPWPKKRQWKHRFVREQVLQDLFQLQKIGSQVEFKTDSRDYFDWALEEIKRTQYTLTFVSYDLHKSEMAETNFVTQFESIFLRQGLPIHLAHFRKDK